MTRPNKSKKTISHLKVQSSASHVTLLDAGLKAICGIHSSYFLKVTRQERPFHLRPLRASAMFASATAELTFGKLDSQAISRFNCEEPAGPTTTHTLALGRDRSDQLMTTGMPVQEKEMHELFIKWKSSKAE